MNDKQTSKNKILAAHHEGGPGGQGGAQQGTGARGEQYLDGPELPHTLVRTILFGNLTRAPQQTHNNKNSLTECPIFRSKRTEAKRNATAASQAGVPCFRRQTAVVEPFA